MEMLYESLASQIESQIKKGVLKPGDRIPSVRKMSDAHGVSVSTVLQAYMTLEGRGFIEARPQSGYYVKAFGLTSAPEPRMIAGVKSSGAVNVADDVRRIMENDRRPGVLPFACATPHPSLFPTVPLSRLYHQISRKLGENLHAYTFPPGDLELRRQIARKSMDYGCTLDPEHVVITIGGMEALNIAIRAVAQPGDAVAIESPTYYGILQVLQNLGIKAIEIPISPRDGICFDDLKSALKKHPQIKAFITMPNFHNPMGALIPEEKKEELVKLLTRHDIPIIEDAVYSDLHYDDKKPSYLKRYDKKDQVILCSSFSKTLSPGARLGWIYSERFSSQILNLKMMSTIASPTLTQAVVAEFLKSGGYERHVRQLRKKFESQVLRYQNTIAENFPKGTSFTRPRGGFVLWVELPSGIDAWKLYEVAIRENISFTPGTLFTSSNKFRNCLRISCGMPWSSAVERGLSRLGQLASRLA